MILDLTRLFLSLLLPTLLLLWLLKRKAESRAFFFSMVFLVAVFLFVIDRSIVGAWEDVGTFWPIVFLIGFVAILIYRLRKGMPAPWLPRRWSKEAFITGLNVVHAVFWGSMIPGLLQARAYATDAFEISPPLRNGKYYVSAGGANFAVNQHAMEPVIRYAMDITRLNSFGLSTAGLFPSDLGKYAVFGAEIIAPCSGEVISAESGLPNRKPRDPDDSNRTGGNHVVLYCEGHSVHLAHMDTGSVAVVVGDHVGAGRLLGRVGSSGNSMAPHLHISAVRGRHADFRKAAAEDDSVVSVPLLIDGRFLIKGDSFTN